VVRGVSLSDLIIFCVVDFYEASQGEGGAFGPSL
jgi:hypothetical protein